MNATIRLKSFAPARQLYDYDIIAGDQVVGSAQLRLEASRSSEMPSGFESNVYYQVAQEFRGNGYATTALKAMVQEAKKHGLASLSITVDADNLASIKVIEKCGGKLAEQNQTTLGVNVMKYTIKT